MNMNKSTIVTLCLGWVFALPLGLAFGLSATFALMLVWTILLLLLGA